MSVRSAQAEWKGNLAQGSGSFSVASGAFEGSYSFRTRMEDEPGTNPEELIGAAHASCFSMALAHGLSEAGHTPDAIRTSAKVHFEPVEGGFGITRIVLETEGSVPGVDEEEFRRHAEEAKQGCPVSRALAATEITLEARLAG
jgi:osmotically inducible protein OsmC